MGDCCCFCSNSFLLPHKEVKMKSKIDSFVINQVKSKRVEKKLSQAALAFELGVSIGFIGKAESSKYPTHYNIKHLNDLAKILHCSPRDFLPQESI